MEGSRELSGGDASCNSKHTVIEENNNEINLLSNELANMVGLGDTNLNNHAHGDDQIDEKSVNNTDGSNFEENNDYSYHSDDFEDESNDKELEHDERFNETKVLTNGGSLKGSKSNNPSNKPSNTSLSTVKSGLMAKKGSQTSMSSGSNTNSSNRMPVKSKRLNMSFTNDKFREIEKHNYILLSKILDARKKKSTAIPSANSTTRKISSNSVKKQQQLKVERENLLLLRKIQTVKPSTCTRR